MLFPVKRKKNAKPSIDSMKELKDKTTFCVFKYYYFVFPSIPLVKEKHLGREGRSDTHRKNLFSTTQGLFCCDRCVLLHLK